MQRSFETTFMRQPLRDNVSFINLGLEVDRFSKTMSKY